MKNAKFSIGQIVSDFHYNDVKFKIERISLKKEEPVYYGFEYYVGNNGEILNTFGKKWIAERFLK